MSFLKRFSFFLLPSVFSSFLSVFILPFTTAILGPEDYGVFAMVSSFAAVGSVVATAGAGFLFSAHYTNASENEKQSLVSTVVFTGIFMALSFSALVLLLWNFLVRTWTVFADIPLQALFLALGGLVAGVPWVFATDILTLEGRARRFASILVFQSTVSTAATLLALYAFDQGLVSLVWGSFSGSLVTACGALFALRHRLSIGLSRVWCIQLWRVSSTAVPASILETLHVLFERSLLSVHTGLHALGLYSHSQQYRSLVMMPVKAAARSVWPETLEEARQGVEPIFQKTRQLWDALYILITVCGVFFATLGADFISLLTHDKFTDAYVFATLWMVYLLIQHMGKPHTGLLLARGHGRSYSGFQIIALMLGIASLFFLIPLFGLYGAFISLIIQMLTFRVLIQWHVRRIAAVPFQDGLVLLGSVIIIATLGISWYFHFGLKENILLLIGAWGSLAFFSRHILKEVFKKIFL